MLTREAKEKMDMLHQRFASKKSQKGVLQKMLQHALKLYRYPILRM